MTTVLVSDNGAHSADTWAMATAGEIFNTEDLADGRKLVAEQTKLGIAAALAPFYEDVVKQERDALASDPKHCDKPYDDSAKLAHQAVLQIADVAKASPWADKLNSAEWKNHATVTLIHHMQSAQQVERLWHADNNPNNESAKAYKAKYQGNI